MGLFVAAKMSKGTARIPCQFLTSRPPASWESEPTRLFSANASWKWLKSTYPLTKRTLLQYLSYLEESGLIYLVRKFDYSLKEQNLRPRKTYVTDIGLRTAYGFSFSQDRGAVLENAVFLALRQWQLQSPMVELYYWQNGKSREVDFVVRQGKTTLGLIQVSADPRDSATHQREIAPLLSAMDGLKLRQSLVVTQDHETAEKHGRCRIKYVPFWKWVLQSGDNLIRPE
jgi:hypothetical protein